MLTDDNEGYWLAAKDGRLVIQRCTACGRYNHPPRPMCPECHGVEMTWQDVSGRGVVYSYSLLHHPQHPSFEYPVPAVLVDLEEGVRVVSNLVDLPTEDIRIGMAVEVTFAPTADDFAVPVFRPAGSKG